MNGGIFSACAEVNRGDTVYEREYEPRKRLASRGKHGARSRERSQRANRET